MKSVIYDALISKENFVSESKKFKHEIVKFGVPGREIIIGSSLAPVAPVKFFWKKDATTGAFILDGDGVKLAGSAYELADFKTGKLSAEGLGDFQFDRTTYADQQQLYVSHADSLLAHFFARVSPASLATLETQADYGPFCAAVNTLGLWKLLESTHLHGSSRQKNLMMSQFLSFRQSGSHEEFLSMFNDLSARVLSAYESPLHPGFISFDVLQRSTYLNSVDQAFFVRHIDTALEDAGGNLGTTREVQALFQQYYLERGPVATASFSSGAMVASSNVVASTTSKQAFGSSRSPLPGVCPSTHCSRCWAKGFSNPHLAAVCPWRKDRRPRGMPSALAATVSGGGALPSTPMSVEDAEAFISSFQVSYARYEESLARVGRSPDLPPVPSSSFCAFAYLGDDSITVPWYYDNAASVSLVSSLTFFAPDSIVEIAPFPVGGVSAEVIVTHSGRLPWLPSSVNLAYYAPALKVCLISLGFLHAQGGNYSTVGATVAGDVQRLNVFLPDGTLLDKAVVSPNRLASVTRVLYSQPRGSQLGPVTVDRASLVLWSPWDAPSTLSPPYLARCYSCSMIFPDTSIAAFHVNAEQRARCDRAEALHQGVAGHASDDVLAEALHNGRFRWAQVTAADVRLNRRLRGLCPQCVEGKLHAKAMAPSTTEPAAAVGETISFDIQLSKMKSPGGNLARIRSIDEFSGDVCCTPIHSKDASSILAGLLRLVHERYNAHGHRVVRMVADAEPALKPVVGMLAAAAGILLTLVDPGQHIQRAERTIQSLTQRKRAVLAGLPFFLPLKYAVYAERWVCNVMNGLPNSRSRPSTSDILVTGRERAPHYAHPDLSFGAVCMVRQFTPKREALARSPLEPQLVEDIPVAELGVCLGYPTSVPGDFDFLLADGEIVPRRVVMVVNICPFDWQPRRVLRSALSPADIEPVLHPTLAGQQGPIQPVACPIVLSNDQRCPSPSSLSLPLAPLPPLQSPGSPPVGISLPLSSQSTTPLTAPLSSPPSLISVSSTVLDPNVVVPDVVATDPVAVLDSSVPVDLPISTPLPVHRSSRPSRNTTLPVGFWRGAALAACPAMLSVSDVVSTRKALDDEGWTTITHGRSAHLTPSVFAGTYVADLARECATFDTRRPGEYDLDSVIATADAPTMAFSAPVAPRTGSDSLRPVPPRQCKEFPLRSALRMQALDKLVSSTATEVLKQQTIGCLGTAVYDSVSMLPVGAGVVDAHVLYKDKADGRSTCRIAGRGDRLPLDPDVPTHASVCSDGDKMLALSLMQAHCASRGDFLHMRDFDVVGGFLHIKRTSSIRLFLRLPTALPHPLAGKLVEIQGALYGLRESNRLFSLEVARVLQTANFIPSCVSPMTFVKFSPTDPARKCVVSTHVDDFRVLDNASELTDSLITALEARFGKLTTHDPSTTFAGIEFSQLLTGEVVATQAQYISRVADTIGVCSSTIW